MQTKPTYFSFEKWQYSAFTEGHFYNIPTLIGNADIKCLEIYIRNNPVPKDSFTTGLKQGLTQRLIK